MTAWQEELEEVILLCFYKFYKNSLLVVWSKRKVYTEASLDAPMPGEKFQVFFDQITAGSDVGIQTHRQQKGQ